MYKKLEKNEIERFVKKYFKEWGDDIETVTLLTYDDKKEYLINGYYLFVI